MSANDHYCYYSVLATFLSLEGMAKGKPDEMSLESVSQAMADDVRQATQRCTLAFDLLVCMDHALSIKSLYKSEGLAAPACIEESFAVLLKKVLPFAKKSAVVRQNVLIMSAQFRKS